jgi:hypothetical protein
VTLVLDTPRNVAGWTIAALADCTVLTTRQRGRLAVVARKVPVAILLYDGTEVRAVDPAGRARDPDVLEAKCRGILAAVRRAPEGA